MNKKEELLQEFKLSKSRLQVSETSNFCNENNSIEALQVSLNLKEKSNHSSDSDEDIISSDL